jgi:hypothetical protein
MCRCTGCSPIRFWNMIQVMGSEDKRFFFEKKNQKTFIRGTRPFRRGRVPRMKVFCFFSSEKKCFLSTQGTIRTAPRLALVVNAA